jgi:hypothetical protein
MAGGDGAAPLGEGSRMRSVTWPASRPLKIYPTDPTQSYEAALKISILVDYEKLECGPRGDRLEVVDYDGHGKCFYEQIDLEDSAILMQGGLDPSESDPRFHQQMVYAVSMRTLANFDRALGRRVNLRRGRRRNKLRILPHAFKGRNAFYDRDLHALLFGYFDADPEDSGANIPGQTVFTCLSHDIVAHETTHAIVDTLRWNFMDPSNIDVLAFHEGFADIVALFQHFSFPSLVAAAIRGGHGDLRQPTVLVELAKQFGFATGSGKSLRSALDQPDAKLLAGMSEPHDRGAILVAAVFDGFFTTYSRNIADIIRIATGGSGKLPDGELQYDLAARIAAEAARTAQRHLDICIRAFDYLPPVDVTFGDYLRALVTADFELNPEDESGQRAALIEGFRRRGIYPQGVVSMAEESLRWPIAGLHGRGPPPLAGNLSNLLPQLLRMEASRFSKRSADQTLSAEPGVRPDMVSAQEIVETTDRKHETSTEKSMALALHAYADANRAALYLHDDFPISVAGFNAVFRTARNGGLLIELVAQFVQVDPEGEVDAILGGLPVKGGTTIVVGVDGTVRYAIAKPLPGPHLQGSLGAEAAIRPARQAEFVASLDARDPLFPYMDGTQAKQRMRARMNLRALHSGIWP